MFDVCAYTQLGLVASNLPNLRFLFLRTKPNLIYDTELAIHSDILSQSLKHCNLSVCTWCG